MTRTKLIVQLVTVFTAIGLLLPIRFGIDAHLELENSFEVGGANFAYQLITLLIALLVLLILLKTNKTNFKRFFKVGYLKAPVIPVPAVGIKPRKNENWKHVGLNFLLVFSVVTCVVIYLQLFQSEGIKVVSLLSALPYAVAFATSNSFVEEVLFRLGLVISLNGKIPDSCISKLSGLSFGLLHYWGNPGGILGMLAAGFMGWFLTKSILETRGVFWAWIIHFAQDVIIFCALISMQNQG